MKMTLRKSALGFGMAIALGVSPASATVLMTDLLYNFDANDTVDPSVGLDYTLPQVASPNDTGVLPVSAGGGGTLMTDPNGQEFIRSTGNIAYGGDLASPQNIVSYTWELWARKNGNTGENQFAGIRMFEGFGGNFAGIGDKSGVGSANDSLGYDHRDRETTTRMQHGDALPYSPGAWHQFLFTFQDATGEHTDDGQLRMYLDGNTTPVAEFLNEDVYMFGGSTADLNHIVMFAINSGEADRGLIGDIAVMRVYDRVLTDTEILGNYNGVAPGLGLPVIPEPGMLALLGLGVVALRLSRRFKG